MNYFLLLLPFVAGTVVGLWLGRRLGQGLTVEGALALLRSKGYHVNVYLKPEGKR